MNGRRARWLMLACVVLAAGLIYSCDDDDNTTCPTPTVCSDPTKDFLGSWTLFESYTNGMPDQMITAVELEFETNDVLEVRLEGLDTLTWWWMADESNLLIADRMMNGSPGIKFEYGFEADTLNLNSVNADEDYYWRLHRK